MMSPKISEGSGENLDITRAAMMGRLTKLSFRPTRSRICLNSGLANLQLQEILLDRNADLLQWQVVGVLTEGVLDLDADLLDAEEDVCHDQCDGNCHEAEPIDERERKREAIDHQGPSQVDCICEGQRRRPNPLARPAVAGQRLDVLVHTLQLVTVDQIPLPGH